MRGEDASGPPKPQKVDWVVRAAAQTQVRENLTDHRAGRFREGEECRRFPKFAEWTGLGVEFCSRVTTVGLKSVRGTAAIAQHQHSGIGRSVALDL